ncbi:MAG TPA: cytidine deaminase [Chitinophagales bacterium]|nr:cytidine deaminase [Chitinophagales bacterium]
MKELAITITYKELENINELPVQFQQLLLKAKEAISDSYAPYSNFHVGAAALLENGVLMKGSNQENASSPVGICAERVALSAVSALYPNVPVVALAISVKPKNHSLNEPVAPCGLCRQSILEYEERFHKPIQVIFQGESGKIVWIDSAKSLLPFSFGKDHLKPSVR